MDDDVKNLFQKFGQPTEAYREINRELDSESAKKRWPLLRDVHLHGGPVPSRSHQHEEDSSTALLAQQGAAFRPSAIGSLAAKPTTGKAMPFAGNLNHSSAGDTISLAGAPGSAKISGTAPLKHMPAKKAVQEEQEPEAVAAPAFLAKIKPAAQQESHAVGNKLFSSLNKQAAAPESLNKPVESHKPLAQALPKSGVTHVATGRQSVIAAGSAKTTAGNAASFLHGSPATQTTPAKPQVDNVEIEQAPAFAGKPASREKPVSAVFGRLAAKQEEEQKTAEAGVNSFFKKIFKP